MGVMAMPIRKEMVAGIRICTVGDSIRPLYPVRSSAVNWPHIWVGRGLFSFRESLGGGGYKRAHIFKAAALGRSQYYCRDTMPIGLKNNGQVPAGEISVSCLAHHDARDIWERFVGIDSGLLHPVDGCEVYCCFRCGGKYFGGCG